MPETVENVTWRAPELYETLGGEGEYRVVGEGGELGPLVVWVDDNPQDSSNGEGHFEVYGGDQADYQYNTRRLAAAEAAGRAPSESAPKEDEV